MSKAKKKSKSKKSIDDNSCAVETTEVKQREIEFVKSLIDSEVNFDPYVLLNHFKKIHNINEKVLEWNDSETLDVTESKRLLDSVVKTEIPKSLESSHFSSYFKYEKPSLCDVKNISICGALLSHESNDKMISESVSEVLKTVVPEEKLVEEAFESKEKDISNYVSTINIKRSRRSTGVKDYRKMANPTLNEAVESNYIKESIPRKSSAPRAQSVNDSDRNHKSKVVSEKAESSDTEFGDTNEINKMEVTIDSEGKENTSTDSNIESFKIVCNNCGKRSYRANQAANFCNDCYGILSKELQKYKTWKDLICIETPPCWEKEDNKKCQACQVQYIIRNGIDLADKCVHVKMLSHSVDQLRTPENVELGRQHYKNEIKRYIQIAKRNNLDIPNPFIISTKCDATDFNYDWCISGIERMSLENSVHNLCSFCSSKNKKTIFYKFLDDPSMFVCNYCLTKGQKIALEGETTNNKCEEDCDDLDNCDSCFSSKLFEKITREALTYKYKIVNCKKCRICYRPRLLRWFDKGFRVCFICIWRVNEFVLDNEGDCDHDISECLQLTCNCCLYKVVKKLTDIKSLINHRIPHQAFKANFFNDSFSTQNPPKSNKRNFSELNGTDQETLPVKSRKVDSNTISSDIMNTKRKSIKSKSLVEAEISDAQEYDTIMEPVKSDLEDSIDNMKIEDSTSLSLGSSKPRIKQASQTSSLDNVIDLDKAEITKSSNKPNGPRVKNVSRKNVKDIVLDRFCTDVKFNRSQVNSGSNFEKNNNSSLINNGDGDRMDVDETLNRSESDSEMPSNTMVAAGDGDEDSECSLPRPLEYPLPDRYEKCGFCENCQRSRNCGKCENCFQRRNSGDKSYVCIYMQCTSPKKKRNRIRRSRLQNQNISTNDTANTSNACLGEGPKMDGNIIIGGTKPVSEVYQTEFPRQSISNSKNSKSRKSVEYKPEDIKKDNINILLNGKLNSSVISGKSEHGFPVITTKKGAPANFVCFTCGSGDGDQMINCSQCANPYHFFCIDLPYRPKSKEMYKCRKCTECKLCSSENSDLKCIKCGLGYHARCYTATNSNSTSSNLVIRYPPAINVSSPAEWVCHLCAMCLHCGESGQHLMDPINSREADDDEAVSGQNQVEWSSDNPFCCAKCQEGVDNDEVCANCARAVIIPASSLENDQLSCFRCKQYLHPQCVPLKEDEYELWKRVKLPDLTVYCKKCFKKSQNNNGGTSSNSLNLADLVKKNSTPEINKLMKSVIDKGESCEQQLVNNMSENMIHQQNMHQQPRSFSQVDGLASESESPVKIIAQYDGVSNYTSDDDEKVDIDETQEFSTKNKYSVNPSNNVDNSTESPTEVDYLDEDGLANNSISSINGVTELHKQSSHAAKMGLIDICKNRYNLSGIQYSHTSARNGRSYFSNPIFSGLKPDSFISCKHMVSEIAARIIFKINRLSSKSESSELVRSTYRKLLSMVQDIINEFIPWVDFQKCKEYAQELITGDMNYKISKIINLISHKMQEIQHKEERVYSSTLKEVIKKFRDSQDRGRDEFVRYHTELHISALEKAVAQDDVDSDLGDMPIRGFNKSDAQYNIEYGSPSKNRAEDRLSMKDERNCVLCCRGGDNKIEGRLLYGGLDVWIHVNCAIWSEEVYEKNEHGLLDGVRKAVENGLHQICSECGEYGATLPCSGIDHGKSSSNNTRSQANRCLNIFHFNCAYNKLADPVFTFSRHFFCSEVLHNTQIVKEVRSHGRLGLADMLILRRIVLKLGCLEGIKGINEQCKIEQRSDDVVVTIGGLRIDSLGKIDKEVSGVFKNHLVPVQFKARRLFWSATKPDKLSVYLLNTYRDTRSSQQSQGSFSNHIARSNSSASSTHSVSHKQRYTNMYTSHKRMGALACRPVLQIDDDGQLQQTKRYSDSELDDDDDGASSFMSRFRNPRPPSYHKRFNSMLNYKYDRPIHKSSIISRNLKRSYPSPTQFHSNCIPTQNSIADNKTDKPSVTTCIGNVTPNLTSVNNQQYHQSTMNLSNHLPLLPKPSNMQTNNNIDNHSGKSNDVVPSIRLIKNQTPNLVNMVQRRHTINNPRIVFKTYNTHFQQNPSHYSTNIQINKNSPITGTNIHHNSSIPRVTSFISSMSSNSMQQYTPNKAIPHVSVGANIQNGTMDGSVLRNVLTTGRPSQIKNVASGSNPLLGSTQPVGQIGSITTTPRPVSSKPWYNNAASNLKIISCGSLNKAATNKPTKPVIHQYDGVLTSDDNYDEFDDEDDDSVSVVSSNISSSVHAGCAYKRPAGFNKTPINLSHLNSIYSKAKLGVNNDVASSNSIVRFSISGWSVSKNPSSAWSRITKKIMDIRRRINNNSGDVRSRQDPCVDNRVCGDGWRKFGLDNKHVIYLLEQLKDAFLCEQYEFKLHKERAQQFREMFTPLQVVPEGVSRFMPYENTSNHNPEHIRDPLNFLACQSNKPPPTLMSCKRKNSENFEDSDISDGDDIKDIARITDGSDVQVDHRYISDLAFQFINLQTGQNARINNVQVYRSTIHERGLFSLRSYAAHELVIEYVGELIRASVSDIRESKYQRKGVDCYMFKLDRYTVIDATVQGNAARFINHSCNPNCYAKIVKLHGNKHILIIASRAIKKGEEFTYDYQFPTEEDKVECKCGAFSCRKYLN